MSVLEASSEIQVWNNAAFDSGGVERERSVDMKASWMDLDRQCLSASIESDSSKENHNPLVSESLSPAQFKTPVSNTPLLTSNALVETETTTLSTKIGSKKGLKDSTLRDEAMIDKEIEQIEMEMSRLSLKLESLRLEKAEKKKLRIRERRCSIVPAKYMEINSKRSTNSKTGLVHKNQDSKAPPPRRGVSLCPSEIYSATNSRKAMTKPDVGSSSVKQSRRQSCFWKLGEIDELKVTKQRGANSVSVSPKLRNPVPKFDASRKAVTTTGAKKVVRKNDAVLASVQPKKLFKETEKSATLKKSIKPGRVVASRYNQNTTQNPDCSSVKVRSLFVTEESESSRVKKRWEIPAKGDVVVYMRDGDDEDSRSTVSVDEMGDVLRKIRTVRCVNETPRDSGAVKRVADLVGKKSFFADADLLQGQALSFVDEEEADADDDAQI